MITEGSKVLTVSYISGMAVGASQLSLEVQAEVHRPMYCGASLGLCLSEFCNSDLHRLP